MSFGRLGNATLAAGVESTVYTVPAVCVGAEVSINVLNPGGNDANVEIAISSGGSTVANEYIEKGVVVAASGGTLEHSEVKLSPGEKINVKSSQAGVVVRVSGKELSKL